MANTTAQDLLALKEKVEEAKTKVSELNGQQKVLLKQLKEDYKCGTIEAGETKLKKLEEEINTLEGDLADRLEKLKTKYNIDEV